MMRCFDGDNRSVRRLGAFTRGAAAGLALLLAGCGGLSGRDSGWKELSVEDSRLIFGAARPGSASAPDFASQRVYGGWVSENAIWAGEGRADRPTAGLYFGALAVAGKETVDLTFVDFFVFYKDGAPIKPALGPAGSTLNAFGPLRYRPFRFAGRQCVGFLQADLLERMGGGSRGRGAPSALAGYYCAPVGQVLTASLVEAVLTTVGIKGVYAPSLLPAQDPVPLAIKWGEKSIYTGAAFTGELRKGGALRFVREDAKAVCEGRLRYQTGSYDNPDRLPQGGFSIQCSNGEWAGGNVISDRPGKGRGVGRSGTGTAVRMLFGEGAEAAAAAERRKG